jgi:hypothetical protein
LACTDLTSQDRVEQGGCFVVSRREFSWHPGLLSESPERNRPLGGRRRQGCRLRVGAAEREDRVDLTTQDGGVEVRELGDQREVDQILWAGARAPALVSAGVGVELFCDLQLQRDGVDLDRLDPRKAEEVLGVQGLGLQRVIGPEADVEQERLEGAPGQGR